ncbi:MAG TPA: FAD-dependent oxidoreductase [Kofleriaceae bacterium]|nr:FAD-dependent oxidoreductase [Kofleriaceae bacterium]
MGIAKSVLPTYFDVAIIGAGPVGLAIAIELARLDLTTLVVDRRPPPAEDTGLRPQLLVARAGDLANLAHLGVDVRDPRIVTLLASRCEADLATGRTIRGGVATLHSVPPQLDLWTLAAQPPRALVPIGRLQQALLERALHHGASVHYGCEVTRVRRHARFASLTLADGVAVRAALVVIATGAARSLALELLRGACAVELPEQRIIGALFDAAADEGRWIRVELPVPGLPRLARATVLQTTDAGTGVLVSAPGQPTAEQLGRCFITAARAHGLLGAPMLVEPQIFATAVTAMARRTIAGDGRAPIVIAGDAAQTGHVFTGQTCFVNVALALRMARELQHARRAIALQLAGDAALLRALDRYEQQSQIGAAILARTSQRHYAPHRSGQWALAGVARANGLARRAFRLGGPFVFRLPLRAIKDQWPVTKSARGGRATA